MTLDAPRTRAQLLAERIELSIVSDGLSAGDPLGTMEEWHRKTGFGRATVSEAVRIMVERGSVEVRPGRTGGLFVSDSDPVVALERILRPVYDYAATEQDAWSMLAILDRGVMVDAAVHRVEEDILDLRRVLGELEAAQSDDRLFRLTALALHERIAQITSNALLKVVYLAAAALIRAIAAAGPLGPPVWDRSVGRQERLERHRAMVDAIAAGDVGRAASLASRIADDPAE